MKAGRIHSSNMKSSYSPSDSSEETPSGRVSVFRWILYYFIAFPVLALTDFLVFNLKVEGRKNLKGIHGVILVSNHVHYIDSGMIGCAVFPRRVIFVSHIGNFSLPVYGWWVRQIACIPIGETFRQHKAFLQQCTAKLEQGRCVAIYPEGDIEHNPPSLQPFTNGAFQLAVRTGLPVLPLVVTIRPSKGIRRVWQSKNFYCVHIGLPIYPEANGSVKARIEKMRERTYTCFQRILERS